MTEFTIELPAEVCRARFEAEIAALARNLGLQPRFNGFRKIKFIPLNPNSVDQRIRPHLRAVPTLRVLADGSKVGAAVRNSNFDDVPPGAA